MQIAEQYLRFDKLIKVVPTTGSGPLHGILSDGGSYFCKKSNFLKGCKYDLANEVIAANVLCGWGLFVPDYQFVKIDFSEIKVQLVEEYRRINSPSSLLQVRNPFDSEVFEIPFFASKEFLLHLHLEKLTSLQTLKDFQVKKLEDFFSIILFDLWFHNVDRKGTNSNTLIASDKNGTNKVAPIDHVQCFGVNRKFASKKLTEIGEPLPKELTLLQLRCVEELLLTLSKEERNFIADNSTDLLRSALVKLQSSKIALPEEWNAVAYYNEVVELLSNQVRNNQVLAQFKNMLIL